MENNDQKLKENQTFSVKYKQEFEIGDIVYLKTDIEQLKRIITRINIAPGNSILYYLSCGIEESQHYGIEISRERDIVLATSN